MISRDRKQYELTTSFVHIQTQTDVIDLSDENKIAEQPEPATTAKAVESSDSSNESDIDDNVPQEDTTSSSQANNPMVNSMATSVMTGSNLSYDTEDTCEKHRVTSDDDNLESLRKKVNELIIETTSNIDSYSTNSSTNTIINKSFTRLHSKKCERANNGFSCTDLPNEGFVDSNKNIRSVKCSCTDEDDDHDANSIDEDVKSCSDDEFEGAKKFNYSLRMKR